MTYFFLNTLYEKTTSDITTATTELPITNPQLLSQKIAGGWSTVIIKDSVNKEMVRIEPFGDKVKMIRTDPKFFLKGSCIEWTLSEDGLKETVCVVGYCGDGKNLDCAGCK